MPARILALWMLLVHSMYSCCSPARVQHGGSRYTVISPDIFSGCLGAGQVNWYLSLWIYLIDLTDMRLQQYSFHPCFGWGRVETKGPHFCSASFSQKASCRARLCKPTFMGN